MMSKGTEDLGYTLFFTLSYYSLKYELCMEFDLKVWFLYCRDGQAKKKPTQYWLDFFDLLRVRAASSAL